MAFDEQHAKALRHGEEWRQAALAFEHRAMRVEYVIRLLVAAGHVSQEKVDEAFNIARDFKRADGVMADRPLGCALAMRVMQSRLYQQLDAVERADCDELVQQNLEWFKRDSASGVMASDGSKPDA